VGKGGRCVRLTTLPPYCAVVMKSGNLNFLEPSGPLQVCNGIALPFYWQLKEEALDRTLWRTFGRGDGPVIRLRDDNFQIPFGVPFVYLKPKLSYGKALLEYQVFKKNLRYKVKPPL